jgi:hypothetical protein
MSDLSDRAQQIAQWTLGFTSYRQRGDRLQSDRALREYLIERLSYFSRCLNVLRNELTESSASAANAIGDIGDRLADLADSIRAAAYEFDDFMTLPELDEDAAEEFYDRDLRVLREAHRIQSAVEPTLTDASNISALTEVLEECLRDLTEAVETRQASILSFAV